MSINAIQPVVLAGGAGTRLWPLSRSERPKQYLPLLGNGLSLLQNTLLRLQDIALPAPVIIINAKHRAILKNQLAELKLGSAECILEPATRNTAPAVALAALRALAQGRDPYLLVLPADHLLADSSALRTAVQHAVPLAERGYLTALGVTARYAETRYGYILAGEPLSDHGFAIESFVEKPNSDAAAKLFDRGDSLWNSGIFLVRASDYVSALEGRAPAILSACRASLIQATEQGNEISPAAEAFGQCENQCINRALMEKTERRAVVPLAAEWVDIGHWKTLFDYLYQKPRKPVAFDGACSGGTRSVAAHLIKPNECYQLPVQEQQTYLVAAEGAAEVSWSHHRKEALRDTPLALPPGVPATVRNAQNQPLKLLVIQS